MSQAKGIVKTCGMCGRVFASDGDFLRGTRRFRMCSEGVVWFNCGCGTTLILPPEKIGLFAPEKGLSDDAANVFVRLVAGFQFPRFPAVAARFEQMLCDPSVDAARLALCVADDPVLAGRILQSATFHMESSGTPVRSIERAIAIVGRDDLRRITLVSALGGFEVKSRRFTTREFWREAFVNAALMEPLSKRSLPASWRGVAHLCASLCNLGQLARAFVRPDEADAVADQEHAGVPHVVAEAGDAAMGVGHDVWGEIAGALWGLPDIVSQTCILHHTPDAVPLSALAPSRVAGVDGLTTPLRDDGSERDLDDLVILCVVLADERRRSLLGEEPAEGGPSWRKRWAQALFGEAFLAQWLRETEASRDQAYERASAAVS